MTSPSDLDAMALQVGGAWEQMLTIGTAQGLSREDLMVVTVKTAAMILRSTTDALWPSIVTPDTEIAARAQLLDLIETTDGVAHSLTPTTGDDNRPRLEDMD